MMTSPSELSYVRQPHTTCMLLKSFGEKTTEKTQNLEEFVACLEEERVKIDAFKRELPLCMQLLNNAMEASRQELESQRTNQVGTRPVLEEFIPLKNKSSSEDKANWMASAQLWNRESEEVTKVETDTKLDFVDPFSSKDHRNSSSELFFPELALASSSHEEEMENTKRKSSETREIYGKCGNISVSDKETTENTSQNNRKARRCWSPDLHRRFVNALHKLGGSQVATPKQIRELMKVDGLTNDEVKSHLQKYRLHTRSPNPGPQAAVPGPAQVVFLGGIWVPPEYAAHGGPTAAAFYGAHAGTTTTHHLSPPFYSTAPPGKLYPAPPPPPENHQFDLYNRLPLKQRNSFSESDVQGGGDRSESFVNGKSKSYC